jgi:predicted kinase
VCPDEIRRALHGERYLQLAEPMVWTVATLMVRALFGAGHERVILDACNNTRKRRDPWSKEFPTVFKVIDTSAETCLERALNRGDQYIVPIIGRMAQESEPLAGDGREPQWDY